VPKKVLCAGEINVDLVLQGYTEFPVPGKEVLVRDAQLVLGTADEKKEQLVGENTDAGVVGLYAVLTAPDSWERVSHAARYKSEILQRKVPYRLVTLVWSGRDFKVTTKKGEIKPGAKQELL